MATRGVAKRYAQAVFEIAKSDGSLDTWLGDLTRLANAASDPVAGTFLTDPSVHEEGKQQAAAALFPGDEKRLARNLALMLIERRRFDAAPEILEVYRDLVLEARGIAIADVTTAVPLSPQEADRVRAQLKQIVGRDIELRSRVDPALIGGLVARIGDRLIDGSVASQLRDLRGALAR